MAHDVFISYSSRDRTTADAVCALLEARGIRCWIAPRDIMPGVAWAESIIDALESARVMVLIFSSSANVSPQIQREVERAASKGVVIVPLRIEDAKPTKTMEYFISTSHWLDAIAAPLDQHIPRLTDALASLLARTERKVPSTRTWLIADLAPQPGSASQQPAIATRGESAVKDAPGADGAAGVRAVPTTSARVGARWSWQAIVWALAVALAVVVGVALWATRGRQALSSRSRIMLAVLPFRSFGNDPEQEYFTDGLTEETITQLAQLRPDRLGVIASTSAMAYKQSHKTIGQIGQELGVDYVLDSSVGHEERRLRMTVQLGKVTDQTNLWAHSYERDFDGVFAIQKEVAREISRALTLTLLPDEVARLDRTETVAPDAHEAFLKGRFYWNKRTQADITTGLGFFQQAITIEPRYARAYAGLADSYNMLARYDGRRPESTFAEAKTAALKALEIDPNLAEAHTSLGYVLLHNDWDWKGAETEFTRAIALNAGYATAHQWYARYLTAMGRHDESIREIRIAQRLDPRSLIVNAAVAYALYFARDYDEAIQQGKKTLLLDPTFARAHFNLGLAYLEKGSGSEAVAELETAVKSSPDSAEYLATLGHAYARLGRRDDARSILARLSGLAPDGRVSPYLLALVHSSLGDADQAIAGLEQAFLARDEHLVYLQVEPAFERLRAHPRLTDLVRRVGLRP